MSDGRRHVVRALATTCALTVAGTTLLAGPAAAEPDLDTRIDAGEQRVERLDRKAQKAEKRLERARKRLETAQVRLGVAQGEARRREVRAASAGAAVPTAAAAPSADALTASSVVVLENPASVLDQVSTLAAFEDPEAKAMAGFVAEARSLVDQQTAAHATLARLVTAEKQATKQKKRTAGRLDEAQSELADLEEQAEELAEQLAEERAEEQASRSADRTGAAEAPVAASGGAGAAVAYAMDQVGDSYSYGAAGPDAFDCSGLTSMAWAQAGVSLPRTSGSQMGAGPSVSQSQLQPGDLVFYYSPVSHVGIYIGNGQIVHAANPSTGVSITGVNSMPYAGAVRPG